MMPLMPVGAKELGNTNSEYASASSTASAAMSSQSVYFSLFCCMIPFPPLFFSDFTLSISIPSAFCNAFFITFYTFSVGAGQNI